MQFQFKETMRGRLEQPDGGFASFEFTITARARSYVSYILGESLVVNGAVSLQGVTEGVPVTGTLKVALPVSRFLSYDLCFKAPDGSLYRYIGRKDIRYIHFFRTMSWLKGMLFRNGEPVGPAELWFSYRELPAFLFSFRPGLLPGLGRVLRRLRLFRREPERPSQ
jgi:hypothetical protein